MLVLLTTIITPVLLRQVFPRSAGPAPARPEEG
jgi:hypothetical protein